MLVEPGGVIDGKPVSEGGLRHLQGVFLVEVGRGGESIAPVDSRMVLQGGDRLCFVGQVDNIVDLQSMRGLVSTEKPHLTPFDSVKHTFFEAVVGVPSRLTSCSKARSPEVNTAGS